MSDPQASSTSVPAATLALAGSSCAKFPSVEHAWQVLCDILDPEIPVLSIVDLGIVRDVRWVCVEGDPEKLQPGKLHVGLTPTYSGCPATDVIRRLVHTALLEAGYQDIALEEVLSPPWSSDWLSEAGRRKLEHFGIAPPQRLRHGAGGRPGPAPVSCPRCASRATERISEFGSTPCKAHYRCTACLEPFDYFKCL